ncbi:MAG TPA: DUF4446 family protein [Candidatus Paceibacterota bacterium]|jgi:hypothetical protein|nr:DUF4446 family protein [Candidatus Paceibacterota bacterium]
MNIKLETAFFILALILLSVNFFWLAKTEKRLKKFFAGKKAKDLEDIITSLSEDTRKLESARNEIQKELSLVNGKLKKSIRGVETVRFNPFPDQGGNQSFALGFVNEDGDGVVVSSLYSRERTSVFAKPVKGGRSEYELTSEEKEALKKAAAKI